MKKFLIAFTACLITLSASAVNAEEAIQEKVYKKGAFSLSYPQEGWQLTEMPSAEGKSSTNVKIVAKGSPALSIVLNWDKSLGEITEAEKNTRSPITASAFGIPIALSIAGNKSENIIRSVGLINLAEMSDLSTRFIITTPGSQKITTLDSFIYMPEEVPGNIVMGAIISEGSQDFEKQSEEYFDRLYEAYLIVQSIALKAGK